MIAARETAEDLNTRLRALSVEDLVAFAARGARAQEMLDNIIEAIKPISILAVEPVPIGRRLLMVPAAGRAGVKTGWRKANGQPGAICSKCGAQDGTVMQTRCKACRAAAPSASVPPSRLNQSKDGVPLNARGTPRPACSGCGVRNGRVRMGRCEDCRKKGVGKIHTGRRYAAHRKTSPPLPTRKPRKIGRPAGKRTNPPAPPADSSTEEKRQGPVSDAWIAAFKARAVVMPKLLTSWGVGPVIKLIAAGGRPLYEKLPPALRKEVSE